MANWRGTRRFALAIALATIASVLPNVAVAAETPGAEAEFEAHFFKEIGGEFYWIENQTRRWLSPECGQGFVDAGYNPTRVQYSEISDLASAGGSCPVDRVPLALTEEQINEGLLHKQSSGVYWWLDGGSAFWVSGTCGRALEAAGYLAKPVSYAQVDALERVTGSCPAARFVQPIAEATPNEPPDPADPVEGEDPVEPETPVDPIEGEVPGNDDDPVEAESRAQKCRQEVAAAFAASADPENELGFSSEFITDADGERGHLCDVLSVYYPGVDLGAAGRLREAAIDVHPQWVANSVLETGKSRSRNWIRNRAWLDGPTTVEVYPPEDTALVENAPGQPLANLFFNGNTYSDGCLTAKRPGVTNDGLIECDEFPNASTVKAGRPPTPDGLFPAHAFVLQTDNNLEGQKWKQFLAACLTEEQRVDQETAFEDAPRSSRILTIPVAEIDLETSWVCRPPIEDETDSPTPDTTLPAPAPDTRPEPADFVNPRASGTCTAYPVDDDRPVIQTNVTKGSLNTRAVDGVFFTWNIGDPGRADYIAVERGPGSPDRRPIYSSSPRVVSRFLQREAVSDDWAVKLFTANDELIGSIPCVLSDELDGLLGTHPVPNFPCTHLGTDRADRIVGTSSRDIICPLSGDDVVYGLDGDDLIFDFVGNNRLFGGPGDDLIQAGLGNDVLEGSIGDDYLSGGAGDDVLRGDDGDDRLANGPGNDFVYGGAGADLAQAFIALAEPSSGDDTYYMEGGRDRVTEPAVGSGDDHILMGTGADSASAGDGNDFLHTESDFFSTEISDRQDTLNGGAGDDVLVHITPAEAVGAIPGPLAGATLIGGPGGDQFLSLDASWDSVYFEEVGGALVTVPAGPCAISIGVNAPNDDEVVQNGGVSCNVYGVDIGLSFTSVNDEITDVDLSVETVEEAWALFQTIRASLNGQPQAAVDTCICDKPITVKNLIVIDDPIHK